jgi:hypothetical protein
VAALSELLKQLPNPNATAWRDLQHAYDVQVDKWDRLQELQGNPQEELDTNVPSADVRSAFDLVLHGSSEQPEAVEQAMEVLLEKWDDGVLEASLEVALSAAVSAETAETARTQLLAMLEAMENESVNEADLGLQSKVDLETLICECRLDNTELEQRLFKVLGIGKQRRSVVRKSMRAISSVGGIQAASHCHTQGCKTLPPPSVCPTSSRV